MASKGRSTRQWKKISLVVYAEETNCWLCGRVVDHDVPPRTRWGHSVDHIIPISQGGAPYDRANLRLAHHGCNSRRSNNTATKATPGATRHW